MFPFRLGIAVVSAVVLVGFASLAPASDRFLRPTENGIERLLQEKFADDKNTVWQVPVHERPTLLDLDLVELERGVGPLWTAEVELRIDYGPPPPSILGFERVRSGRYELVLKQTGDQFELQRMRLVGRIHLLPVAR